MEFPEGAVFEVQLNEAFVRSPLWRDSRKGRLAFDAITKTAAVLILETISPTYPTRVLVLAGDKPIRRLGRLKVANPATEG